MGDMEGEEGGGGEAEVDVAGIGVGGIEKDAEWDYDYDVEETGEDSWLIRCIIALLFEPIMIPYWDGSYMGGNRPTWFTLSVT
jgi:hypothetical protein